MTWWNQFVTTTRSLLCSYVGALNNAVILFCTPDCSTNQLNFSPQHYGSILFKAKHGNGKQAKPYLHTGYFSVTAV